MPTVVDLDRLASLQVEELSIHAFVEQGSLSASVSLRLPVAVSTDNFGSEAPICRRIDRPPDGLNQPLCDTRTI